MNKNIHKLKYFQISMNKNQILENFFLKLINIIEKPVFREVNFKYEEFFKILRDYLDIGFVWKIKNSFHIDFNKEYENSQNKKLELIFMLIIEKILEKEEKLLKKDNLENISLTLKNHIKRREFLKFLKILNMKISNRVLKDFNISNKNKIYSNETFLSFTIKLYTSFLNQDYTQKINENFDDKISLIKSLNHNQLLVFKYGIFKNFKDKWLYEIIIKNPKITNNQVNCFIQGIKSKKEEYFFKDVLNLPNSHIWAFEQGAKNNMPKWYFKYVKLLSNNHALAFEQGAKNNMPKWYFKQIINLPNSHIWAFEQGAKNNMPKWYFKQIINLPNSHIWAFEQGAKNNMPKWYFEIIKKITIRQLELFEFGVSNKILKKDFYKLITEIIKDDCLKKNEKFNQTSIVFLIDFLNSLIDRQILNQKDFDNLILYLKDRLILFLKETDNNSQIEIDLKNKYKIFSYLDIKSIYILISKSNDLEKQIFENVVFKIFLEKLDNINILEFLKIFDSKEIFFYDFLKVLSKNFLLKTIIPKNSTSTKYFLKKLFLDFLKSKNINAIEKLSPIFNNFKYFSPDSKKQFLNYSISLYHKLKGIKKSFLCIFIAKNEKYLEKYFPQKVSKKLKKEIDKINKSTKDFKIEDILLKNKSFKKNKIIKTLQVFYNDDYGILCFRSFLDLCIKYKYKIFHLNDNKKVFLEKINFDDFNFFEKKIFIEKKINDFFINHEILFYNKKNYLNYFRENFLDNKCPYISWMHRGHSYNFKRTFNYDLLEFNLRKNPLFIIIDTCLSKENIFDFFVKTKTYDKLFLTKNTEDFEEVNFLIIKLFEEILKVNIKISLEKFEKGLEEKYNLKKSFTSPTNLFLEAISLVNNKNN